MSRIAKRYGRALFNLTKGDMAKAKRQLEALNVVRELFEGGGAGKVLSSPVMPPDLKKKLLDYALDKADADQDTRHLIDSVIYGARVALLPKVADAFAELIDEAEGVVRAEVKSAVPLSGAETAEIGATLGSLLKKQVHVKTSVDPALLGGLVANVGNFRIDMSLKTRLEGLSQSAVMDTPAK